MRGIIISLVRNFENKIISLKGENGVKKPFNEFFSHLSQTFLKSQKWTQNFAH